VHTITVDPGRDVGNDRWLNGVNSRAVMVGGFVRNFFREAKRLLTKTYVEWDRDNAPRLGAALAYYTILSLAPLLILTIAVGSLAFGKQAAQGELFGEIKGMVGATGAEAIEQMVRNASKPGHGILASLVGFVALIFGASSVTSELRNALNTIWGRKTESDSGIKEVFTQRSWALLIVLGCGFLLVVSLVVSSTLAGAAKVMANRLPIPEFLIEGLDITLSWLVLTGVFAVLFKYLPDIRLQWSDVFLGAGCTAVLFTIGKFLIGLYLGRASFGSTYGAAGSLVTVLVWVYYSAQIFFFGAEFTQVYTRERRSTMVRLQTAT